ncbi:O-methyltransferase [Brevundimonas sp.]|uniref:O-methyltransferase n=1 Tax=Brevundimonas sp. TaxID=1871086 RepID=UPI002EDACA8A
MSGASIPYHLRPHKAVDRRIFVDLLSRIERWRPLSEYVYLSMGAYPLEDHKLIHRTLGVTRLIAFDYDPAIVARQTFNRPIGSCHCVEKSSGDVVAELDQVLDQCGFGDPAGVIVWLDYTDPKKLGEQIREFQSLLDRLSAGDVVRVTVNAHPNEMIEASGGKPLLKEERRAKQFQSLQGRIKEFMPSWASADHMNETDLPKVIAESFAAAALKALPVSGALTFRPLSMVRYADSAQMLSMTGVVAKRSDEGELLARLGIQTWPFASDTWSDIHKLVVPNLTLRERLFLEREVVTTGPDQIVNALGFDAAGEISVADFIDSYKRYYRFYPTLLTAEL